MNGHCPVLDSLLEIKKIKSQTLKLPTNTGVRGLAGPHMKHYETSM